MIQHEILKRNLEVGTIEGEGRLLIQLRVELHTGPQQTIAHEAIDEAVSVSFSGVSKYRGGQIQDTILPLIESGELKLAIDQRRLEQILLLWDRWHLNTMHGECIHQERGAHVAQRQWLRGDAWEAMAEAQRARCPRDYHYGSSWLVEVIPTPCWKISAD